MALASAGLLSVAGFAFADDPTSGYSGLESMDAHKVEQKFQINPGFTYNAEADFDDSSMGDVSVWRLDIPARYTLTLEKGELALGGFYEYSEYDFSDLAGSGDQEFNTLAFDAVWKSMFNDKWGYFLYGGIGMSSSTETCITDGFTGVGGLGGRYVVSPDLNFGLGVAVASQLEDDAAVLPIIIANWRINDQWNLRVLNGATISYDINAEKRIILDLGAKYQRRQYAMDENDTAAIDKAVNIEFGATYNFSPTFGIRGFVGVAAARNIEIREDDHKLDDEDVDSAAYFGVRALFTF